MFDMIREWPRYVNVPFPIAKASVYIDGFSLSQQHSVQRYLFVLTNFWNTFDSMLLICVFS